MTDEKIIEAAAEALTEFSDEAFGDYAEDAYKNGPGIWIGNGIAEAVVAAVEPLIIEGEKITQVSRWLRREAEP